MSAELDGNDIAFVYEGRRLYQSIAIINQQRYNLCREKKTSKKKKSTIKQRLRAVLMKISHWFFGRGDKNSRSLANTTSSGSTAILKYSKTTCTKPIQLVIKTPEKYSIPADEELNLSCQPNDYSFSWIFQPKIPDRKETEENT